MYLYCCKEKTEQVQCMNLDTSSNKSDAIVTPTFLVPDSIS